MSYLAQHLGIKDDMFTWMRKQREYQSEFLVDQWVKHNTQRNLPYFLLGYSCKKNSSNIMGSSGLLCEDILRVKYNQVCMRYDLLVEENVSFYPINTSYAILLGRDHDWISSVDFPSGSVILDPFRFLLYRKEEFAAKNIQYIPIGISTL